LVRSDVFAVVGVINKGRKTYQAVISGIYLAQFSCEQACGEGKIVVQ